MIYEVIAQYEICYAVEAQSEEEARGLAKSVTLEANLDGEPCQDDCAVTICWDDGEIVAVGEPTLI